MAYLRMTIAKWSVDTCSDEARRCFEAIATDGVAVFRAQPGFVDYRLMRADDETTIAVAEWESKELGEPGARAYREWMRRAGVMDLIRLETWDGEIVARS